MYAIAFDLSVQNTNQHHPKGVTQAYSDIRSTLNHYNFIWRQGSLYTTDNDDMANLFLAIQALRALPWFPESVRDVRAFRVEQWSDFTALVKA